MKTQSTKSEALATIAANLCRIASGDVAYKVSLKEGLVSNWTYAKECKITPKEFLTAAISGGVKGGWTENRVRAVLRNIDPAFKTRDRAKKEKDGKVKFSDEQLVAIQDAALDTGMTSDQIEALLLKLA